MPIRLQNILCVDDEPVDLRLLARSFAEVDPCLQCELCENAEQAFQYLLTRPVDLAVLDIHMPGLDGLELMDAARAQLGQRMPPVIFLTASDDPEKQRVAYAKGAIAYMFKPAVLQDYGTLTHSIVELWRRLNAA
ncbi:MAG: response regulator [Pseudomonadota bacterium]